MKLWGGRCEKGTAVEVDDFHSSIHFDWRMYRQDIQGSIAHARMLGQQGIISKEEAELICTTLNQLLEEIESGSVQFSTEAEDIHMNIESLLIERIGDVGKKLHTGRSRNDQVAPIPGCIPWKKRTGFCNCSPPCSIGCWKLLSAILRPACQGTLIAESTACHSGHHLMAYFEMFRRDMEAEDAENGSI